MRRTAHDVAGSRSSYYNVSFPPKEIVETSAGCGLMMTPIE